jgi:23S rRNA (cytidine2498-2'-O)-methyltransferase
MRARRAKGSAFGAEIAERSPFQTQSLAPGRALQYRSAMFLVLAAADSRDALHGELSIAFPGNARELAAGMFACELAPEAVSFPLLAFARQLLPHAREVKASSIRTWAGLVVDAIAGVLPDHQRWSLHVYPFEEVLGTTRMGARAWHSRARAGEPRPARAAPPASNSAGPTRCRLIREAVIELLQKRRRHLVRYLRRDEGLFVEDEALVQLVLTSPDAGFFSIAPAPLPFAARHSLSCFAGGQAELATDKQAPSRAFAKLVEAEARMNRRIAARETCVDLAASPGGWTYVALQRGAKVTAVDRAELRPDLMQHHNVRFERGDAFRFEPAAAVDWLLCDVIASAERTAALLVQWLQKRWCRHFVVTLKVDDEGSLPVVSQLKRQLPELTSELWLLRLCANKKEVCAFGTLAELPQSPASSS